MIGYIKKFSGISSLQKIKERLSSFFSRNPIGGLLFVFLTWGTLFLILWLRILSKSEGGIFSSWIPIWGDWSEHIGFANVFAHRSFSTWFTHHPIFYGTPFNYPFLPDLFPGLLMRIGMTEVSAFHLCSFLTTLFFLGVLYYFYLHWLKSIRLVFFALSLFFLSGGLGFYHFLSNIFQHSFVQTLALLFSNHPSGSIPSSHLFTFFTSILLPQRGFLLGVPVTTLIVFSLSKWIERGLEKVSYLNLVLLGACCPLLILVHTHSYMVLFILCLVLFVNTPKPLSKWIAFGLSSALISYFVYNLFHRGSYHANFFGFQPFAILKPEHGQLYWIWFVPLALAASWKTGLWKNVFVIGGFILLLMALLFRLQPWIWDNTKFLCWGYLLLVIPVAEWLSELWKRGKKHKIFTALIVFLITVSGVQELVRVLVSRPESFGMWGKEEIQIALDFVQTSNPNSIVLTSNHSHHWVLGLTGRQVLMAYPGWIWSMGIDYQKREQEEKEMFAATENGKKLLKEYSVDYVVVDPITRDRFKPNTEYFLTHHHKVLSTLHYEVFQMVKE